MVACYARMAETGWLSVIITDEEDLFVNANTLQAGSPLSFSAFYLLVMVAGIQRDLLVYHPAAGASCPAAA